ncbi:MAG: hypothetical protein O7D91_17745 [Planctomycetota bacterium]|nr:hypothetical protein [Planctomycetota bacterium]
MRSEHAYSAQKNRLAGAAENALTLFKLGAAVVAILVVLFVMWVWMRA